MRQSLAYNSQQEQQPGFTPSDEGPDHFKQVTQWKVIDGSLTQQLVIAHWLHRFLKEPSIASLCFRERYGDAMKLGEHDAKTTAFLRMVTPKVQYDYGRINVAMDFLCPRELHPWYNPLLQEFLKVVKEAIEVVLPP